MNLPARKSAASIFFKFSNSISVSSSSTLFSVICSCMVLDRLSYFKGLLWLGVVEKINLEMFIFVRRD